MNLFLILFSSQNESVNIDVLKSCTATWPHVFLFLSFIFFNLSC